MPKGLLSLVTLVLLAGAAGQAQQPSFRSDVNVVEVHAVVTDSRGNFIKDLSKDDFEIYEDGRLQKPSVFSLVDVPVVAPPAAAGASEPVESDVRASSRSFDGRLYVLVLDDLHTMTLRSHLVRQAARRFVERHLGIGDLAAVVYTSGRQDVAQELTGSRRLLLASIDKFQGQKLPSATAERLAVHLNERDMNRASESTSDSSSSSSSSNAASPGKQVEDPLDPERGMNARRAFDLVKGVAKWMGEVRGRRKALVMFSEGIDYDIYDVFNNKSASSLIHDAREAVAAAQRANVSIYAVDPRGLTQLGDEAIAIASLSDDPNVDYGTPRGFQRELLLAQESLMSLAEQTGGVAIVKTNDIAGGLGRIVRDNSQYYVLGYPTDPARGPGKFRKIDVKVKRPGVQVRARRGYVPPDPKAIAKRRDKEVKAGTTPALAAALNNPLPIGDLPVRVFAAPFRSATPGKNASVVIAIEIDGRSLKYEQRDDRFFEKVEASIVAADYEGKVRGTDRQTLDLKLRPDTHQKMSGGGVRLLSRVELPPSRYQIRIGVHESVGGAISTVAYDLEVPDYAKVPFALSGLVLTSTGAAALMTVKPDPLLKDVFPAPPIATRAFTQQETVAAFAELYDNSTPAAHTVDLVTTVTATTDGRTVFSTRESRTSEAGAKVRAHGYKVEIPLRDVAPGTYVLRVTATSQLDKRTVVKEVPFEVVAAREQTF